MSTVLISFLGRSKKEEGNYRTTVYSLEGKQQPPTAYVGYLLREYYKPKKMVVLGTAGSMWDNLFEINLDLGELEDQLIQLVDSVERQAVAQSQLTELAPLLGKALGCEVELTIIPAARNQQEQIQVLQSIADATFGAEKLTLDVTHGFRHLPMLAYTAILYLQTVQPQLRVEHILYGEYDPETGKGEIHDLVGLVKISNWQNAIQHSETTGDYSQVSELVVDKEIGGWLKEASFYENTHRAGQARSPLKKVRNKISNEPLTGPAALFQPLLLERTSWVEENLLYQRQRAQAYRSLERKDFLRAALYGFEAFITQKVQEIAGAGSNVAQYEQRRKIQEEELDGPAYWRTDEAKAYKMLRNIRNTLAHGNQNSAKEVQQAQFTLRSSGIKN